MQLAYFVQYVDVCSYIVSDCENAANGVQEIESVFDLVSHTLEEVLEVHNGPLSQHSLGLKQIFYVEHKFHLGKLYEGDVT